VRYRNRIIRTNETLDEQEFLAWKRRPSEIRGYQRTLYTTAPNGDYLRVDYHLRDKKVRLYLEDNEEGGLEYYAVIHDGKITLERNLSTGRSTPLYRKFIKHAENFATIANRHVLKIMGDNYGIMQARQDTRDIQRKSDLELTRRRYFRAEQQDHKKITDIGSFHATKRFSMADIFDLTLGLVIATILYLLWHEFMFVGIFSAIYGVVLGLLDMFIREREPIFMKIVFFVVAGTLLYLGGYYYL
jgi:hypothetical protein